MGPKLLLPRAFRAKTHTELHRAGDPESWGWGFLEGYSTKPFASGRLAQQTVRSAKAGQAAYNRGGPFFGVRFGRPDPQSQGPVPGSPGSF